MHVDWILGFPGPDVPDVPLDEMSEQDLRNLMAYLHGALSQALMYGYDEEVVGLVRGWHDEVFVALAEASEQFRQRVREGAVFTPDGPPSRPKYLALTREASES